MPSLRHQVVEVPPLKPHITEFRCHGRECGGCGAVTYADLPPDVAGHTFGERLTGIIVLLSGKYQLSKCKLQDALSDLLGVRISLGSISNREAEVADALAAPVAEAEEFVREADAANADETGWFEGKANGRARRAWLWVVATSLVVIFRISSSRGSEVIMGLLGENFTGFLTTARWSAYNWYDLGLQQLCWSHLTRDFQSFTDRGVTGARIGVLLMKERDRMFKWWHRVRDGTMAREDFERRMKSVKRSVARFLRGAEVRAQGKTAGMYRKTSFGTQSPEGSRLDERILTVVTTLRLQERNVLEYLTTAIGEHRRQGVAPSLLPVTQPDQLALAA